MSTRLLRNAIAEAVQGHEVGGVSLFPPDFVHTHPGRFGRSDLERYARAAPCAVVAWLGTSSAESQGGQATGIGTFAIVVLTRDTGAADNEKRDAHLMDLTDELAKLVILNRWGDTASGKPERVEIENGSAQVDDMTFAMGAVTWRQRLDLAGITGDDLDPFLRLHADWIKTRESIAGTQEPAKPDGEFDARDEITLEGPDG